MNEQAPYLTYDEARTRKVSAEAEIAELELAKVRSSTLLYSVQALPK